MKGLWWKIAVPAVAVAAAVGIGVFFLVSSGTSTIQTISNSFAIMGEEITARIDKSPLKAAFMLEDAVKDGSIALSFDYNDTWYEQRYKGNVSLSSNADEREFAIAGAVTVDYGYGSQDLDAELYINKERVAIGSKLLDTNYYGFRYDTFDRDLRSFTGLLGLNDEETLKQLSEAVDMIGQSLNTDVPEANGDLAVFQKYIDLYGEFRDSIKLNTEKVKIESGGVSVNCTKIDFVLIDEAFISFIRDLYDMLEKDDVIRERYEQALGDYYDSLSAIVTDLEEIESIRTYNGLLKEIKKTLDEFEDKFSGEMTVTLYIAKGDRMLRIETESDIRYDGDRAKIGMTVDFGESLEDRWKMAITVDADDESHTLNVDWRYSERSSGTENIITVTEDKEEAFTLSSIWNTVNGDFTISIATEWDNMELTGNFMWDDTGFDLALDDVNPDPDESLVFTLKVDYGASIKNISYINMDSWNADLISKIENMVYSLLS